MIFTGTSVCGGAAVAPALLYAPAELAVRRERLSPADVSAELERYEQAVAQADRTEPVASGR